MPSSQSDSGSKMRSATSLTVFVPTTAFGTKSAADSLAVAVSGGRACSFLPGVVGAPEDLILTTIQCGMHIWGRSSSSAELSAKPVWKSSSGVPEQIFRVLQMWVPPWL